MCFTPSCSKTGNQRLWGLCSSCYNYKNSLAIDPEEYITGRAGSCTFGGCTTIGDLQLDHDNSCCKKIPSGGRCGRCNRGFLCRKHNISLSWFEAIDDWALITDPTSSPFIEYLTFWRDHPRPLRDRTPPGMYSALYLRNLRERALLDALNVIDDFEFESPGRYDEYYMDLDNPDYTTQLALENPHA